MGFVCGAELPAPKALISLDPLPGLIPIIFFWNLSQRSASSEVLLPEGREGENILVYTTPFHMLFFSHPGAVTDGNICIPVSDITTDEETKAQSKSWDHPAGQQIRGGNGKETIQHAV